MDDREEAIGRNVNIRRGERSQQDVADEMRTLGWKWSQATMWAIEKGERPLRLAEAFDLAGVLGIEVSELLLTPEETTILRARDRTQRAEKVVADAVTAYEQERYMLRVFMESVESGELGEIGAATRTQATSTLNRTVDDAVLRGLAEAQRIERRVEEVSQEMEK